MSAKPVLLLFFRKNIEVAGLYSPTVSVPLPSQSPTMGTMPLLAGPKMDTLFANPPALLSLSKNLDALGS